MTHVGAVGEIVSAKFSSKKLIEKSCFIAGASGSIKYGFIWMYHLLNFLTNDIKCLLPGYSFIFITLRIVAHRFCETTLLLKPVSVFLQQVSNCMFFKKFFCYSLGCSLGGDSFYTVFAKLGDGIVF